MEGGLDLEKQTSIPVEAELFFLTSLFIELIDWHGVLSANACFQKPGTSREAEVSVQGGEQYSNVIYLAAEKCVVDMCFKLLLLLSHFADVGRACAESSFLHTAS